MCVCVCVCVCVSLFEGGGGGGGAKLMNLPHTNVCVLQSRFRLFERFNEVRKSTFLDKLKYES